MPSTLTATLITPSDRRPPAGVLMRIRRALGDRRTLDDEELDAGPPEQPEADEAAFARLVARSLDELPDEFLRALEHVPVIVGANGAEVGAYGLYHGAGVWRPDVAAQIVIYRDTLERDFGADPEALSAQIRRTVRHELAHHLGYGEDGVAGLGL